MWLWEKVDVSAVLSLKCAKVGTIGDLRVHKSYDLCVEVLNAADEEVVSNGLRKQDLVVADDSGSSRLTLWEEEVEP